MLEAMGRCRWSSWLLNNCSLHLILYQGLLGPGQKHQAAILPTLPLKNQGPCSPH